MFNTQIDAIVPMLCVTLAALASMGAEAFRREGDRMPIGVLGVIGLMFSALAAVSFGTATLKASASSWPITSACSSRSCSPSWVC